MRKYGMILILCGIAACLIGSTSGEWDAGLLPIVLGIPVLIWGDRHKQNID